jgi:hypothetical protein
MRDVRKRHICEMSERDIYARCPKETYMRHNLRCSKIKYTHEAERISQKTYDTVFPAISSWIWPPNLAWYISCIWQHLTTPIFDHSDIWPLRYLTTPIFDHSDIWPLRYLTSPRFDQSEIWPLQFDTEDDNYTKLRLWQDLTNPNLHVTLILFLALSGSMERQLYQTQIMATSLQENYFSGQWHDCASAD